jgi:hypothetical protein
MQTRWLIYDPLALGWRTDLQEVRTERIELDNGVSLAFVREGARVLGLTGVRIADTPLTPPQVATLPMIDAPEGWIAAHYTWGGITREGADVVVEMTAVPVLGGYQERCDWYDAMIGTVPPPADAHLRVRYRFTPITETLGEQECTGFTYTIEAEAVGDFRFHRILDRQVWAVGGSATGNTVINQSGYGRPEYTAALASRFTTREEFEPFGTDDPFVFMQLRPRFAVVQSFDYCFGECGTLVGYFDRVGSINSLTEKHPGTEFFTVYDQHLFPLSDRGATIPKRILFAPADGQSAYQGRANYLQVHTDIFTHYRRVAALPVDDPLPLYQIEVYTLNEQALRICAENPSLSWFQALGQCDAELDKARARIDWVIDNMENIAAAGYRLLYVGPMLESDWTMEYPSKNCCAPLHYEASEALGGWPIVRRVADAAHRAGLKLIVWVNPVVLSTRSPMLAEHPEWAVIDRRGARLQDADGVFAVMDFANPEWRAYWMTSVRKWLDAGVDHFFFDSYPNYYIRSLNYAAGGAEGVGAFGEHSGAAVRLMKKAPIIPHQELFLEMQRELAKEGTNVWIEGVGPVGVSSNAANISPDEIHSALLFHSDLRWYFGKEYAAINTNLRCAALDFRQMFRFTAFKAPLGQDQLPVPPETARLFHAYAACSTLMKMPYLLEEDAGVFWLNAERNEGVLFTFDTRDVQHARLADFTQAAGLTEDAGTHQIINGCVAGLSPFAMYRVTR